MKKVMVLLAFVAASLTADVYKAVYDLSSGDMRYMLNRIMLIEKTAKMIKAKGDEADFVVTIHSGATPMLAKLPDMYADEEDVPVVYNIHGKLENLIQEYGVRVLGCDLATTAYGMEKDEILPFIETTPNSIIDLIGLENKGYTVVFFVR
jgi:intracellular sulfur oxidation DsrE/DsrF family protein